MHNWVEWRHVRAVWHSLLDDESLFLWIHSTRISAVMSWVLFVFFLRDTLVVWSFLATFTLAVAAKRPDAQTWVVAALSFSLGLLLRTRNGLCNYFRLKFTIDFSANCSLDSTCTCFARRMASSDYYLILWLWLAPWWEAASTSSVGVIIWKEWHSPYVSTILFSTNGLRLEMAPPFAGDLLLLMLLAALLALFPLSERWDLSALETLFCGFS